jgi:hypothetical protein
VGTDDLPAGASALVVSRQWRDWLRSAAAGDTVRAKATPADCGRSPLRQFRPVRLADAGQHSGAYAVAGDTGGYDEYDFGAGGATPPADATVNAFGSLPSAVRDDIGRLLDGEGVALPPQRRTHQYIRTEGEDGVLWVRRDGTTHRVYARVPTITPPCDYHLVLRLSPTAADRTLSLAGVDEPGRIATDAEAGTPRSLSRYPRNDATRLREFGHVMTRTGFCRVQVLTA